MPIGKIQLLQLQIQISRPRLGHIEITVLYSDSTFGYIQIEITVSYSDSTFEYI